MPVRKSPFTNTEKSTLFCSPKVNISLLFTEDLQNGEILGWICIDNGLFWIVITGVYCGILGPGLWSPSAARSTRSGRKNRASEQRDDFFGHRKADGANAAAGYLWSASVRSTDLFFPIIEGKTIFVSSTAKRQRGLQRGKPGSLLPCFASFCRSKRKAPAASGAN